MHKRNFVLLGLPLFTLVLASPLPTVAQGPGRRGTLNIPSSSNTLAADLGVRAHTNIAIMLPTSAPKGPAQPQQLPPFPGYAYETPASIACVYQLVPNAGGDCNPNGVTENPSGGSGIIAVVDAYDDPHAAADLHAFSDQFGLPYPDFSVVYAGASRPPQDPTGGWELEESLDIEWAHAMAPSAKIELIEANSNLFTDLFAAVAVADEHLKSKHGEVTMSWGGAEFAGEAAFDVYFHAPHVVYFAAVGDEPGVDFPAALPRVVAAGGTSLNRNPFNGNFLYQDAWQDSGGGPSVYVPRPKYQDVVANLVGDTRGSPDVSFDSNPYTGLWVYDSIPYLDQSGWFIVGGTSAASASLAGIHNASTPEEGRESSLQELDLIYANLGGPHFTDITYGNCGPYGGFLAIPGWDFCTGVGTPFRLGDW